MNFLEPEVEQQAPQYPAQIQQTLDQLIGQYNKLEEEQAKLEAGLRQVLILRNRAQQTNKIKKDAMELVTVELEQIGAVFTQLLRLLEDPLQQMDDAQRTQITVVVARYRQLLPQKRNELLEFAGNVNRALIRFEEVEDQDERQNEAQRLVDIDLTAREERLANDQRDINSIAKDVDDVVQLVGTITLEVQSQAKVVNDIDRGAERADEEMDNGIDQLLEAQREQTKGKKYRWVAVAACAAAVVVLVVVLCLVL